MFYIWNFPSSFGKRKPLDVHKEWLGLTSRAQRRKWNKVNWATFYIAMFLAESHKPCQEHMRSVAFADFGYLNCWQNNAYRVLE